MSTTSSTEPTALVDTSKKKIKSAGNSKKGIMDGQLLPIFVSIFKSKAFCNYDRTVRKG